MTLPRFVLLLGLLMGLTAPAAVHAQSRPGTTGIGGQIGDPSGLSVKVHPGGELAYDFLAAWDLSDDFFFLNVHGVYERSLGDTPLGFYYGPGLLLGIDEGDDDDDRPGRGGDENEVVLGLSGTFGFNFFIERFELFGRITPRLLLVPATEGDIGGGIGVRYYF
ncbi:MAG: hypothetical protein GVY18_17330 [Bacteroidetes bacterium]|jgi:hypothetical protein|nr:hypothetical protein [Bacteroidota bacterium]